MNSREDGHRSQRKVEREVIAGLEHRLRRILSQGTASQRKLADFVLRHPIRVAAASIEDLGRVAGVSAPTISRFAREMEFAGFAEMRAAIADATQALMDPVTKLKERIHESREPCGAAQAFDVFRRQLALVDGDELGGAVQNIAARIHEARSVYVAGWGLSAFAAGMLAYRLAPFHPSVINVVQFGGSELAMTTCAHIRRGDLLLAITVPRYTQDVVRLANLARERGAHVAVLTDSMASPLASLADDIVLAPCSHPILPNSLAAIVAICETLASAVMLADPSSPEKARSLVESFAHHVVNENG
ncbi:MAG: MurR/RpiR family transcriptional regulator [Proteobacteria bacterium]|nr:MurR/RpiR family transcriptional regulator [Pseudomonadota bacterium]